MQTSRRSYQNNITESEYLNALRESDKVIDELTQAVDKFVAARLKLIKEDEDTSLFQKLFFNKSLTTARVNNVAIPLSRQLKEETPLLNAIKFAESLSYLRIAIRCNKALTELHKSGEGELQPILNNALVKLLNHQDLIDSYVRRQARASIAGLEGEYLKQTVEIAAHEFMQTVESATGNFLGWLNK